MIILGIESSCDETGAAIIKGETKSKNVKILSNVVASSLNLHSTTGGIIPEIAAREQIKFIIPVIQKALEEAKLIAKDIDAIAVTYGPGLIGSLLIGVETAKSLSMVWNKPLIPTNHLLGHVYANFIEPELYPKHFTSNTKIEFPALALIVSGAHTDLILIKNHKDIVLLGGTRDDAAGECFDKSARLLGYNYPGGPKIAELALKGNPKAILFPRPMIGSRDFEFSFSGLKTAFLYETKQRFPILRTSKEQISWDEIVLEEKLKDSQKQTLYDLCASLQHAIIDVLVKKTIKAAEKHQVKSILLSGGVAANELLRNTLEKKSKESNINFFVPPKNLCTDNGAMIAAAAFFINEQKNYKTVNVNPGLYF